MGQLVADDIDDSDQLRLAGGSGINQKGGLPVGDAPKVLHCPEGKVGDGNVVDLQARVRNSVVIAQVSKRKDCAIQGESG